MAVFHNQSGSHSCPLAQAPGSSIRSKSVLFQPGVADPIRISHVGECSLLFEFCSKPDLEVQRRIWLLADALRGAYDTFEVTLGVGNLLVIYDPLSTEPSIIRDIVCSAWEDTYGAKAPGRLIEIPVIYGGDGGIDLVGVAEATGLLPSEVVRIHADAEYVVAALGAHPGYAYLIGLDDRLFISRRTVPRQSLPANSIVIAGGLGGITGCASASGWHVLGRSRLTFFDAFRRPPALLSAGDRVKFHAEKVIA
ncbi:5-oxoprolinase subunit PxpB [Pollutimonas sp. H1-120]|uniref:5-oxoprolinase subunit PxpB n=1 Tax=Pollutimonas sp. H1-120 TaxID=3148824 RepID=UPI003B51C8B8